MTTFIPFLVSPHPPLVTTHLMSFPKSLHACLFLTHECPTPLCRSVARAGGVAPFLIPVSQVCPCLCLSHLIIRASCKAFEFWWFNGQKMKFHCNFNLHFFLKCGNQVTHLVILLTAIFIFLSEFFVYRPLSLIKKQASINWKLNPWSVMYALCSPSLSVWL